MFQHRNQCNIPFPDKTLQEMGGFPHSYSGWLGNTTEIVIPISNGNNSHQKSEIQKMNPTWKIDCNMSDNITQDPHQGPK